MSNMVRSIIVGQTSTGLSMIKPYPRSQALSWNPISKLAFSKCNGEISLLSKKTRFQYDSTSTKRNSFVVYANTVPGVPLPSAPPPSSGRPMSWILGLVVSFILPFFTNKWGPLWVIKNRIDTAVQTVENIVETVEKVAEGVDKIAEEFADDLPEGNLKNLARKVEHLAEQTAKTADSLDNVIDKAQEAEEQLEGIVGRVAKDKEAKISPKL